MSRYINLIVVFFCILFCSCNKTKKIIKPNSLTISESYRKNIKVETNWHHKDIISDSIPGISLNKTYNELLKNKIGETVVIAVLDGGIDINHDEFKESIWTNPNEIPNNFIDDDNNGYIDDINGWNFLGSKNCGNVYYENYEFIRIIKKYKNTFNTIDTLNLSPHYQNIFDVYKKALIDYNHQLIELQDDHLFIDNFIKEQKNAKEALKKYFPDGEYTRREILSIDTKGNSELKQHIKNRSHAMYYHMDNDWIINFKNYIKNKEDYKLNFNYNGRSIIDDNLDDINDISYGNNDVIGDLSIESHGTNVAGIIAASRDNNLGIKGITNNCKIMPIRIVADGDEYDKDVALGIRYAVDNGAQIINLSIGKEYSIDTELVYEAIKYANKKNVLIVCAAGNSSLDTDKESFYPNDVDYNSPFFDEITDNFIKVGSSSYKVTKRIYPSFSNYGKNNVDIFAPGKKITFPMPNNKYDTDDGTSLSAPIVSGIAALILSFYPDLSADRVKEIILKSGVSYDINVEISLEDGTEKLVPFSELSKSGKIANAYYALKVAEEISKN